MKNWYRASLVRRYHTVPTIGEPQTVGAHSYGVAKIVNALWPEARKELVLAALDHDLAELILGDTPSPTKKRFPILALAVDTVEEEIEKEFGIRYELTEVERLRLRAADLLELLQHARYQLNLGNNYFHEVWHAGYDLLNDLYKKFDALGAISDAVKVADYYDDIWELDDVQ